MELARAAALADELLKAHKPRLYGWTFGWTSAVRRFGSCSYHRQRVYLSRALTALNPEPVVKNVLLHEIAHALVGSGHGHDRVWRSTARSIGCDGQRCYDDTVALPPARFKATCGCRSILRNRRTQLRCMRCLQVFTWERTR